MGLSTLRSLKGKTLCFYHLTDSINFSMLLKNRTRKEAAKAIADEEEAKKPIIIPHWKKSETYRSLQKMQHIEESDEPEDKVTVGNADVKTDDEIEEELDKYEGSPRNKLKREASDYSDIPEEVEEESPLSEVEEEIPGFNDMTTVKLHIDYEKGFSVSQLRNLLKSQWHSNFTDYSIERIETGSDVDVYAVTLKVPSTILPEHYFLYKGSQLKDTKFRNLVVLQQQQQV